MANRRQLYRYKGDRCAHCGRSVQEMLERYGTINRMFQFNHVDPSKKHPAYENLIERVISSEQLDEVDKCVLMCNECHGILHAQNMTGELLLRVEVSGKKAEQRLQGQFIVDNLDRRVTFLTNEQVLVVPYRVSLGSRKPQMHFGSDLKNGLLEMYFKKISRYKSVVIRSWRTRDELMRATYTGGESYTLTHDISFPLFTSELRDDNGKSVVWIRNGIGLTKDGAVYRGGKVTLKGVTLLTAKSDL